MKKIITGLSVLCIIQSAFSQEVKKDTSEYYSPFGIEVNSTRLNIPLNSTPFSINVVSREQLKNMPKSICIDEPMKLVPGVKVDNQADGERVHLSMRGQGILSERGIRGIKVILDGIPLNDPTGFTPDVFDVDWSTIDKIEVLKGPSGSLYGGSSSSGVINITTLNGDNTPLNVTGLGQYGTFNFWKGLIQLGATVNKVNYRLSVSRMMGDGYRVHSAYYANNVYGKLSYMPLKNLRITPLLMYTDFYNQNPEGLNLAQYQEDPTMPNADAEPKNEYQHTIRFTAGINGSYNFMNNHDINFVLYGKRTHYMESVPSFIIDRVLITPGGSLQYTFHTGKGNFRNHFSLGADACYQNIDEHKHYNLGNAREDSTILANQIFKQTSIGVFAINRLEIGKYWSVFVSGRYDKINNKLEDQYKNPKDLSGEENFSKATGKIGINFAPTKTLSLYANWGTGFMPPATEELVNNPENAGGFNKNLISATSMGEEFGVRYEYNKILYTDLTLFHLKTDNDFDRYRISTRPMETFYRNTAASQRLGAELYFKFAPIKYADLQCAYTYSNFKYKINEPIRIMMDDTNNVKYIKDGNKLPNSPDHELYLEMQLHPVKFITLAFSTEYYSKSYIDGANAEKEAVEPFTLLHARVTLDWKIKGLQGDVSLFVKNLTDKKYIAFTEPDPGGNSYQPGATREVFAMIRLKL